MSDIRFEEMLINNLKEELKELKQQLAKNEEIIEQLKDESVKYYCAAFNYKEHLKQADQDKISFAVEQLEQVRKLVDELLDNCGDKQYKVWEVFDNQIKQLKEIPDEK